MASGSGSLQGRGSKMEIQGDPWLVRSNTSVRGDQPADATQFVGGVLPIVSPKVEPSTSGKK